jgi:hypothetical protein
MNTRANGLSSPVEITAINMGGWCKPARPVSVGEKFKSIVLAECFTGIPKRSISAQLAGRARAAYGVVFKYTEE